MPSFRNIAPIVLPRILHAATTLWLHVDLLAQRTTAVQLQYSNTDTHFSVSIRRIQ